MTSQFAVRGAVLAKIQEHRTRIREALGCSVLPLSLASGCCFVHPRFPWPYFNHFCAPTNVHGSVADIEAVREALEAASRPCCVELSAPLSHWRLPDGSLFPAGSSRPSARKSSRYPPDPWLASWLSAADRSGLSSSADLLGMVCDPVSLTSELSEMRSPEELMERRWTSEFRIHQVGTNAAGLVSELHCEAFDIEDFQSRNLSPVLVEANIRAGAHYFCVESLSSGDAVACVALLQIGKMAELFSLGVTPAFRRRGIGSQLVQHCLNFLAGLDVGIVYLFCERDAGPAPLYSSLGFVPYWRSLIYAEPG